MKYDVTVLSGRNHVSNSKYSFFAKKGTKKGLLKALEADWTKHVKELKFKLKIKSWKKIKGGHAFIIQTKDITPEVDRKDPDVLFYVGFITKRK